MREIDILEQLKKEVLEDQDIQGFLRTNSVDRNTFDRNLSLLFQQKQANDICRACKGKKTCAMDVYLMQPVLEYNHGNINQKLIRCKYVDIINEDLLEMMFFPNSYQDGDIKVTLERKQVLKAIKEYASNPKKNKGFFLHGSFGTGKTFLLVKLAREITKQNIKVIFAYYPDLVRHLKASIANNSLESIVNKLKTIDVLMLDDIGGESNTSFVRDEILGPILQYRMLGNLPTFMTSNLNIKELGEHFMETKDGIDIIKSARIIERISFMMDDIELVGNNLRQNL